MSTLDKVSNVDGPRPLFDCSAMVRARVQRASQSPFYSQYREEVTRQSCAVYESKAKATHKSRDAAAANVPNIVDDNATGTSFFPFANDRSVSEGAPGCVTLIGGTGFFGKFVAEQYLNRGINVTVLARDVEKAKAIFVPIASGEREERTKTSQGYVRLGSHAEAVPVAKGVSTDADGQRRGVWCTYRSAVSVSSSSASGAETPKHKERSVTLEIVEGDMNNGADVEFAVRQASMVYFLAPAQEAHNVAGGTGESHQEHKKWYKIQTYLPSLNPFGSRESSSAPPASSPAACASSESSSPPSYTGLGTGSSGNYTGFLRVFDACRRVDAHFVSLTPLWIHGSRLSPVFWYRRLVTHPWGYVKAVRLQELNLLERKGTPSPRCYFGTENVDGDALEKPPMWWYWWSILRSTKLPEDQENVPRSSVRFSLFRLSDIVYPSFNTRMIAVKNNRIDSALHVHSIDTGDLDARLLANVLSKTVSLCNSVVESRVDVGGRLRGDVDMRDTAAVLEMFSHFRNEE